MHILLVAKYPPIQGGVSASSYWLAQALVELGHQITILTNANEVEEEYRINFEKDDLCLLNGFRVQNSICVISTQKDSKHHFVPQANPYLSKLVSLGLEIINERKPDLIWAHYVEPYGVASLILSKLTGIPYVIRHAGSDLGKLGLTKQLSTLHQEVYRQAFLVTTTPKHHTYFKSIGVQNDKLVSCGFRHIPGDLFYSTKIEPQMNITRILVYGKTGITKGTQQLIGAVSLLNKQGFPVHLTAYWGGKGLLNTVHQIAVKQLEENITVRGFIPHWKIPNAIRSVDAVVFLENNFTIPIHSPGIPLEVLSCGRLLITTEEIAQKMPKLVSKNNTIVISGKKLSVDSVADAIKTVPLMVETLVEENFPDASLVYAQGMQNLEKFLSVVEARL